MRYNHYYLAIPHFTCRAAVRRSRSSGRCGLINSGKDLKGRRSIYALIRSDLASGDLEQGVPSTYLPANLCLRSVQSLSLSGPVGEIVDSIWWRMGRSRIACALIRCPIDQGPRSVALVN